MKYAPVYPFCPSRASPFEFLLAAKTRGWGAYILGFYVLPVFSFSCSCPPSIISVKLTAFVLGE